MTGQENGVVFGQPPAIEEQNLSLHCDHARLRVWSVRHRHAGPQVWLLIRRSLEPVPEVKYYISNAEPDVPVETMALVTGSRWRVEEFFEDAKG